MSGRKLGLHIAKYGYGGHVSSLPDWDHVGLDSANYISHSAMLLLTQLGHFYYIKMEEDLKP